MKKTQEKTVDQIKCDEIIKKLEDYRAQLFEDKNVSSTKFMAMQTALHWAKQLVRDSFNQPREKRATAWVK